MIDGQPLSRASKVRDLGVKFDDKFSFTNHIDDVYKRAFSTVIHIKLMSSLYYLTAQPSGLLISKFISA